MRFTRELGIIFYRCCCCVRVCVHEEDIPRVAGGGARSFACHVEWMDGWIDRCVDENSQTKLEKRQDRIYMKC